MPLIMAVATMASPHAEPEAAGNFVSIFSLQFNLPYFIQETFFEYY
jgi:hypothetical protein